MGNVQGWQVYLHNEAEVRVNKQRKEQRHEFLAVHLERLFDEGREALVRERVAGRHGLARVEQRDRRGERVDLRALRVRQLGGKRLQALGGSADGG